MRGADVMQGAMFSYVSLEDRISAEHPLRRLRVLVDAILASMSALFDACFLIPAVPRWHRRSCCGLGPLHGAQRVPADGSIGLQPPLPLVRWP